MWLNCFDAMKGGVEQRAEVSKDILLAMKNHNEAIALTMLCGLILHCRANVDISALERYLDGWQECYVFLEALYYRLCAGEEASGQTYLGGNPLSMHLSVLTVCLFYVELACLRVEQPIVENEEIERRIVSFLAKTAGKNIPVILLANRFFLKRYIACAFLACRQYNRAQRYDFSRENVSRWYRYVYEKVNGKLAILSE